jgi:hypothetical protein
MLFYLFQALRGAAPSYGIMTAIRFRTLAAPSQATNYVYDWHLSEADFANALIKLQTFCMSDLPARFGMTTNIKKSPQHGKLLFSFAGAWYGPQDAFAAVVRPFLAQMVSPTLGKFHVWYVCFDFIAWTGSSFFLAYSYSYLGENHGLDYQLAKPNWKSSAFDFR